MTRRIPIGDFPLLKEERDAIQRILDSGRISEHREVRAFEEESEVVPAETEHFL